MANDWLKLRLDIHDDPAVIAIAGATRLSVDAVVGKLCRVWTWANRHSSDGDLPGVTPEWLDRFVGKRGFAEAMAETTPPWLKVLRTGLRIPRFDRHNGASAKARAENTERQRRSRGKRDAVAPVSRNERDNGATREDKNEILAPAHGDVDWEAVRKKANEVSKLFGGCHSQRDRRLLLGACALSQCERLGPTWLNSATRETKEARPEKPYAFLRTVLKTLAAARQVDFDGSRSQLDIPEQLLVVKDQPLILARTGS